MKTKLFQGDERTFMIEREALREARAGGADRSPDRWPLCDNVAAGYVAQSKHLKTMVGVQEMLAAASIDDYILCDTPKIFYGVKPGLLAVVKKLASDQNSDKALQYLQDNPLNKKLDDCWLRELRSARQTNASYQQAYQQTSNNCRDNKPLSSEPGKPDLATQSTPKISKGASSSQKAPLKN